MKKIRINELARELEVKAHEILERLPELGVTEKKTHSSSIDEDVAIKLRRYYGFDVPDFVPDTESEAESASETVDAAEEAGHTGPTTEAEPADHPARHEKSPVHRAPAETSVAREAQPGPETPSPAAERPVSAPSAAPIRPPLAGRPIH